MSEEVKNEIIDVLKIKINPDIPFVANFFNKDGFVDMALMEKWCGANGYTYERQKMKGRTFTHNVYKVKVEDKDGNVVADMFNKNCKYIDNVAETVVGRIANKVGIKAVDTYMAANPGGSKGTIANNGVPENCKFIEIASILPGDDGWGKNSLKDVFEAIKGIKDSKFGKGDPDMQVDPQIYMDFMKLAIFDFCTAQSDRNIHNYGLIYNKDTHSLSLGPVWDNGNAFAMDNKETYSGALNFVKSGSNCSSLALGYGLDVSAQGITQINDDNYMMITEVVQQLKSPEFVEMVKDYKLDMRELVRFTHSIGQVDINELNAEAEEQGDYVLSSEETEVVSEVMADRSERLERILTNVAVQNDLFDLSFGGGQGD